MFRKRPEIFGLGILHPEDDVNYRAILKTYSEIFVEKILCIELLGNLESLVQFLHIHETVQGVQSQAEVAVSKHIPPLPEVFDAIRPYIEGARFLMVETLVSKAD